jgi:hypothetical protein
VLAKRLAAREVGKDQMFSALTALLTSSFSIKKPPISIRIKVV